MDPRIFARAGWLAVAAAFSFASAAPASTADPDSLLEAQNTEIATLYGEGRYQEGLDLTRRHLEQWARTHGEDSSAWCSMASNLAPLLTMTGDMDEADAAYRLSLACTRRTAGAESADMATVLNNYGMHLGKLAEFGRAEVALEESLRLLRATLGDDHVYVAITLNNLAVNRQNQGNDHAAEPTLRDAVDRLRASLGDSHPTAATAANNLGRLLMDRGAYAEAEPLLRESLAVRDSVLGPGHRDTAIGRRDLGRLLLRRGELDEAEAVLRRALADNEEHLGADHPDAAMSRHELARVLRRRGDLDAATTMLESALALRREHFDPGHSSIIAIEHELGEIAFARGDVDAARERLERATTSFEIGREASGADYDRATYLDSPWTSLAVVHLERGDERAAWATLDRFQARVLAESLLDAPTSLPALPADQAMIGWLDVDLQETSRSYAWVRRGDSVHWVRLDGDDDAAIRELRDRLAEPGSLAAVRAAASRVYGARVAPVARYLDGVSTLIVVPSGSMVGLPIEALVDGDAWLADRWTVAYTPSPAVAAWLEQRPAPTGDAALLVGDPPFRSTSSTTEIALVLDDEVVRGAAHGRPEAIDALPPLPATRHELESIAGFWTNSTTLLGPDASESNLDDLAHGDRLAEFRVLHFATHALVDPTDADASLLVLAQTDLPDALGTLESGSELVDGLVTAGEIVREWRLDADLVTLSACNSARGRRVGEEGFVGFATSFLRVGARAVLASLWSVPDRATSEFMVAFHRAWVEEGRSKAEAVRRARAAVRSTVDDAGRRPYGHPYHWASFVLLGDAR